MPLPIFITIGSVTCPGPPKNTVGFVDNIVKLTFNISIQLVQEHEVL